MTCELISGESLRFHVSSRTRPEVLHLVDFTTGIGTCSCEHYAMTISDAIRSKKIKWDECWHIMVAKQFSMNEISRNLVLKQRYSGNELKYVTEQLFDQACQSAKEASKKGAVDYRIS